MGLAVTTRALDNFSARSYNLLMPSQAATRTDLPTPTQPWSPRLARVAGIGWASSNFPAETGSPSNDRPSAGTRGQAFATSRDINPELTPQPPRVWTARGADFRLSDHALRMGPESESVGETVPGARRHPGRGSRNAAPANLGVVPMHPAEHQSGANQETGRSPRRRPSLLTEPRRRRTGAADLSANALAKSERQVRSWIRGQQTGEESRDIKTGARRALATALNDGALESLAVDLQTSPASVALAGRARQADSRDKGSRARGGLGSHDDPSLKREGARAADLRERPW